MSKHGRIQPGPDETPRPTRLPSLVERAATTYGLGTAMRAPVRVTHLAPVPKPAPAVSGRDGTVSLDRLEAGGFILPGRAPTALSEEFRVIKRKLLGAMDDAFARSILVCSARPDEGKTFCAINLAISLAAERDIDVVLVDGDIAKPEIVATLGLQDGTGLLDAIADPAHDVEASLIRTDIPRLSVLPAGTASHDATELLSSGRTRAVLDRLRGANAQRVIVMDSPPALAASPAGVLAMQCGQALFVVRADSTSEADIREALALLSACPSPKLLLNAVEFGRGNRRFGYYYGGDA